MTDEVIHNLISDLKKLRVKELLFSGNGEPLLCKGLIKEIKEFGKYFKIEILTNGSTLDLIDEELFRNLAYLTISLNSGNGASHQITHGYKGKNKFPEIIKQIERILKFKHASDKIKLNYVITTDNYDELDDFYEKAIRWNVLFMARPVDICFPELEPKGLSEAMLHEIMRKAQEYLKTRKLTKKLVLSFQLVERACNLALETRSHQRPDRGESLYPCYLSFIQPYIESNGDVLLCSSGAEKPLGNINEQNFLAIWQDKKNVAVRILCTQMNKTNKAMLRACATCTNVLYHSTAFHGIYSKIPLLPKRLAARAQDLKSYLKKA
jgi:MoaA/NifB/PqqE/SkfB family radical SAM enzyme